MTANGEVHVDDGILRRVGWGRRHVQMALLFLGFAASYANRVNLSICIVEMTAHNSSSATHSFPTYDWDQSQRGLVLSAFFWGYVLMQIPGGVLAHHYGPKRLLLLGVAGCGLLSLAAPLVASGGWQLLCALRMMQGLVQGTVAPSVQTTLARWAPPSERGMAGSSVYSGSSFGAVVMIAGSGWLASSPLGWPAGFYVPGGLALLWGLAWLLLGADSPATCSAISREERDYIEGALGSASNTEKKLTIPWRCMLTSVPVYCLLVAHCAQTFNHWMLLTQLPSYMKEVLFFDIKQNGLYSALPFLCYLAASPVFGWTSKIVNERGILSIGASRKFFNTIAHWGGGTVLLFLALLPVSAHLAVGLLTLAVTLKASSLSGFIVNHVDLTPNFGGALMGFTNTFSQCMGIIAPVFVSTVVGDTRIATDEEIQSRWSTVFICAACVYFIGNSIFVLGGSGEVQNWNSPPTSDTKDDPFAGREILPKEKIISQTA